MPTVFNFLKNVPSLRCIQKNLGAKSYITWNLLRNNLAKEKGKGADQKYDKC